MMNHDGALVGTLILGIASTVAGLIVLSETSKKTLGVILISIGVIHMLPMLFAMWVAVLA